MYLLVIKSFLIVLVSLCFLLTIGRFLALILGINHAFQSRYQILFSNLLYGIFASTSTTALVCTGFKSILIYIPLFLLLFLWKSKKTPFFSSISLKSLALNKTEYLAVGLTSLPFILIASYYNLRASEFPHFTPHFDFCYYAGISNSLLQHSNENSELLKNVFLPELFTGTSTYHYFELWFNGIIAKTFNISTLYSLMMISFPIMSSTFFIGVLAIIEQFKVIKWKDYILSFSLLFISALYSGLYENFELTKYYEAYTQSSAMGWGKKYLPLYLLGTFSMLLYFKKKVFMALILLLLFCALSIGTAPGILTLVGICLLYRWHRYKKIHELIIYCIFVLTFAGFYSLTSIQYSLDYIQNFALYERLLADPFDILLLKELVFSFVFPIVRILLFYIPYFLVFIIFWYLTPKKPEKRFSLLLMLSTILILGSGIAAALFNGVLDSGQLLYNNLPLFSLVLISLWVLLYFRLSNKNQNILILISIIIATVNQIHFDNYFHQNSPSKYNQFDTNFQSNCISTLNESGRSSNIGYFLNDKSYQQGANAARYKLPCYFLLFANKGAFFVNLNSTRMDVMGYNSSNFDQFVNSNYLLPLYSKHKLNLVKKTVVDIAKELNIRHLYIENNTQNSPNIESKYISKMIVDSISNDVFIALKLDE